MTAGIYVIRNKENGKEYIGQSVNIEKRWGTHKANFRRDFQETNTELQNDWNYFGEESFEFRIKQEIPSDRYNNEQYKFMLSVLEDKHLQEAIDKGIEVYNAKSIHIPRCPMGVPKVFFNECSREQLLQFIKDLQNHADYHERYEKYYFEKILKLEDRISDLTRANEVYRDMQKSKMQYDYEIWRSKEQVKEMEEKLECKDKDIEFWQSKAKMWRMKYFGKGGFDE